MKYALIQDGQIVSDILPQTGYLKDGSSVSGYNLLPESVLKDEGWLPIVEDIPEYDTETQTIIFDRYEIGVDVVNAIYIIADILV